MIQSQWVQFPSCGTKRKRAGLACAPCHGKKIRCDLQSRRDEGHNSCSNCISSSKDCHLRHSKRDSAHQAPVDSRASNIPVANSGSTRNRSSPQNSSRAVIINPGINNDRGSASQACPDVCDMATVPCTRLQHASFEAQVSYGIQSPAPSRSNRASVLSNISNEELNLNETVLMDGTLPGMDQPYTGCLNGVMSEVRQLRPENGELSNPGSLHLELRHSFAETYFEYCYPWCPILSKSTFLDELTKSPLLADALAVLGSNLRPPLIPHPCPASIYARARRRFYEDEEPDLLLSLKAILLFYWWAPQPPSVVHRHSSWWWTSVVIRHAQQAGVHRDNNSEITGTDIGKGMQRRIWWTVFSRERLTAICQGKPCLIDPDDCNVPEPSLADFPDLEDKAQAEVFIYWVRLCSIIGHIAKELSRSSDLNLTTHTFPAHLARKLIEWVQSLPPHLHLQIRSTDTPVFNRAVHQLHLPYLAIIVVLHLTRSSQQSLYMVQALPPAVLAASCIARILKDVLIRSEIGYMMPITCWYCGMAFSALLQASKAEDLRKGANADLEIVVLAVKQMKKRWSTAQVLEKGFERLLATDKSPEDFPNRHLGNERSPRALNSEEGVIRGGIDWLGYFPFATRKTSAIAYTLLGQHDIDFLEPDILAESTIVQFQDFFAGLATDGGHDTLF